MTVERGWGPEAASAKKENSIIELAKEILDAMDLGIGEAESLRWLGSHLCPALFE